MFRRLALTATVVALASHSLLAQQRPSVGPRAILHSIIRSAQLTDEQKAQIKSVVESQRPDIAAAIASHDRMALREALRPVLQEIQHTLTPEQRQAVRAAVRKQFQERFTAR
jgi:hypothetical protein